MRNINCVYRGILFLLMVFIGLSSQIMANESESNPSTPNANLRLFNGDHFHGTLLSFEPKDGIRWKHPYFNDLLRIKANAVREIRFLENTEVNKKELSKISLSNGDRFYGQIIGLKNNNLQLKTSYAAELTIPWNKVKTIEFNTAKSFLFHPTQASDWDSIQNAVYKNNIIYSQQSQRGFILYKRLELANKTRIDFDFQSKENPNFNLTISSIPAKTGNKKIPGGRFIAPPSRHFNIYLRLSNGRLGLSGQGAYRQVKIPELSKPGGNAHFTILLDKETKRIMVFANNRLVLQNKLQGFRHSNTKLQLQGYGKLGTDVIKNFIVHQWFGVMPNQAPKNNTDELLFFVNGDKTIGKTSSIVDSKLYVKVKELDRNIELDLSRLVAVYRPISKSVDPIPRSLNDVELFLKDGSYFKLELESIHKEMIRGKVKDMGTLSIKQAACKKIIFNLHDKRQSQRVNQLPIGTMIK